MDQQPGDRGVDPATLERASGLVGKKWSTTVLRELLAEGPQGFSALEAAIDEISGKVLSDCLEALQEEAVIERRVLQEQPLRVEYALTDRGEDLAPVVEALESWAVDHLDTERTVLLADDDSRLIEMHASWLEDSYEIKTATDGKTARERLDDEIDLLVTDRRMPALSGAELAQYVAASEFDCRVVVLSSVDRDDSLPDQLIDAYLRKPTTPEALQEAVETALRTEANQR